MSEVELSKVTLDLSGKQLKKITKIEDAQLTHTLILDENELQKIDNIDFYSKIETLSLSKNQLLRMYGVCRLHCLRDLNLSFNGILSIEGLKECLHLRYLNLEGNNIKTIEHLNHNTKLEHLNLAENSIGSISDISFLKCLKELYLHGNRLTHLRQCDKYLPNSIEVLTLGKNNIADLNEISSLTNLCNLHNLTISDNPCLAMTNGADGFDHRPFVLNWCMNLKAIDGFVVDPIESLKAEWLYSQGRGRQFRLGEQLQLAKYLSSVCPLIGKALENENERKLRLILCKAQQHQRQLQEEISENSNTSGNNSPSSGRKKPSSRIQSPRFSRLSGRQSSPESMISSYHGNTTSDASNSSYSIQMTTSLIENIKSGDMMMAQSFDSSSIHSNNSTTTGVSSNIHTKTNSQESTPRTITPNPHSDQSSFINPVAVGPLAAASKMVPVPETLMSPDVVPTNSVAQRISASTVNSQTNMTTKIAKNRDNKLSSPKMRSPHLKRERSAGSPHKSEFGCNNKSQHTNLLSKNVGNSNVRNMKGLCLIGTAVHLATPQAENQGTYCEDRHVSTDDESDHIEIDKLKIIRNKAAQRNQTQQKHGKHNAEGSLTTEISATLIQKIWRGYRTRKKTKDIAETILAKRTNEYIEKLCKDMEMTKAQLENERKIQQLQMQAINALWKKVSTMEVNENNDGMSSSSVSNKSYNAKSAVSDLTKTCGQLTNQVQQLQGSMSDILKCLSIFCNLPQQNVKKLFSASVADALANKCDTTATQTEIVAVHTPQIENVGIFPFSKARPSSLSIASENNTGIKKIALTECEDEVQSDYCLDQQSTTSNLCESGVLSGDARSFDATEKDDD